MSPTFIPHRCPVPPGKTIDDPKLILAYLGRGAVIHVETPTVNEQSTCCPRITLQSQHSSGYGLWTAMIPQTVFDALLTLRLITTTADSSSEQSVYYIASFKLPRIQVPESKFAATSAA